MNTTTHPVSRTRILEAIALVHAGRHQDGANVLQAMSSGDDAVPDAFYLLGVLVCLTGKDREGLDLINRSFFAPHSDDLLMLMNKLLAPYGDTAERVRLNIKQHRMIPMQHVGVMSPLGAQRGSISDVEPYHFSRRMTNFFPRERVYFKGDYSKLLKEYVLPGWIPASPPFARESRVLTMGSCFAEELRNYLREQDLWSDFLFVPPGLNNTFALRNFIEWCITGVASNDAYWYDETELGMAVKWTPEEEHGRYREIFRTIDGLVLTIGLAEVWEDTRTGGVFWRGVPRSIFDDDVHLCRLSTVEENLANLQRIVELVRSINPAVEIVITLSPVPLKATNQPFSCISADSISKSVLRLAIHQLMEQKHPHLNYWPSFEIVRWLGSHLHHALFGEDGNNRHVNRSAVKMILDNFIAAYYRPESPAVKGGVN